ncbi:acid protease [Staphylotrichum tortipilum]|uniref:Acid protease n=1 Tax=Staphylotrichum tortipilum TaxID=2831512 RepID=A0AAN6MNZ4_9PEZI|nr:acid protease [Staphylotrichum longicolle]
MRSAAALLLQLTLWAAAVHAFIPFIPDDQCDPGEHCGPFGHADKRGAGSGGGGPEERTPEGITFDLHQRANAPNDKLTRTDAVAAAALRVARKFGGLQPSPTSSDLDKRKNAYSVSEPNAPTTSNSAGIYQFGPDYSYFIKAQVGSAQQSFYMLLDTGAANTWLMGSDCPSEACLMHNTFDPSTSKSWKSDKHEFSILYGTGHLTGYVGQDTASFAGLTLDLSFGLANYTHNDFRHFAFDGILGLATGTSSTGVFLQKLRDAKLVDSLIFSISLNRDSDGVNDGQVTFGAVDKSKFTGDISYTDVPPDQKAKGVWAIPMGGLSINGKSAGITPQLAYIDTGTSFIFAPPKDLEAVFKLVPGSTAYDSGGGYVTYQVPCDTKTPIEVAFSGVTYQIPAQDWVARNNETSCVSRVYGYAVNNNTWLLGDTFLKNVYSVFDADKLRIGFAAKPPPPPKPTSTAGGAAASATALAGGTPGDGGAGGRADGHQPASDADAGCGGGEVESAGLLASSSKDDDDGSDDGIIVHPGDADTLADHRTPTRVRFDLRPTIVAGTTPPSPSPPADTDDNRYPRSSFDFEDDTSLPLHSRNNNTRHQRIPLLTNLEAPAVTLSTTPDDHDLAEFSRPRSSLPAAFMNMANSIIGAGIIGQPYALRQAGLLSGTILLVILTAIVDWTIRLIVVNSKLSGAGSFQGTVEKCFGKVGLVAVSVAQWAFAFGGMVAFGVIVGDSIPSVLRAVWPGLRDVPVLGLLADRRAVIVVFMGGVSYPLALYRDIAKLAKASTLALVSMAVIVVTVVVQGAMVPAEERGSLRDWKLLVINDGIFQAIGVISFAFVCHHNSLLIYGSLEKPTIDRFARVTHMSTAISMVACLLMALAGFLTFGDRTQGNVLNNFPADNAMVNLARLCFGLNMLTTLPLEAFVCREVMLNYYFPGDPFNMNLHLLFTTSLVFSAMVLSLITCDVGSVFDLIGGTSAAAMAYILPPLCYIKLTTRSWKTYAAYAVAAFGCIVMVMSMLQALGKMMTGEGDVKQCY